MEFIFSLKEEISLIVGWLIRYYQTLQKVYCKGLLDYVEILQKCRRDSDMLPNFSPKFWI